MGVYRYRTTVPTIFTEHEVRRPRGIGWHGGPPSNWLGWAFTEADWQRWKRYQLSVWRQFDRIQVFSLRDQSAIGVMAPELAGRVRVNPFGIDLPAMADPRQEVKGEILFVGNFTHLPNVDAALWLGKEIMPKLRARFPGVHLSLVGSLPPDSLRAFASEGVRVTGEVPEIRPFLERAAVVIAPLRIGGGQRMKVLQAMAIGKAVVTTARGADGLSIAGHQPPLVYADDAEGIASATANLLAAETPRRQLGQCARAFVAEYFSAAAYARRLEALYDELLREKGIL